MTPPETSELQPARDGVIRSSAWLGRVEMRREKPTGYMIWDDGVLNQEWEQDWARWEGHYWHHWTEKVWKPVPQRPNDALSEGAGK